MYSDDIRRQHFSRWNPDVPLARLKDAADLPASIYPFFVRALKPRVSRRYSQRDKISPELRASFLQLTDGQLRTLMACLLPSLENAALEAWRAPWRESRIEEVPAPTKIAPTLEDELDGLVSSLVEQAKLLAGVELSPIELIERADALFTWGSSSGLIELLAGALRTDDAEAERALEVFEWLRSGPKVRNPDDWLVPAIWSAALPRTWWHTSFHAWDVDERGLPDQIQFICLAPRQIQLLMLQCLRSGEGLRLADANESVLSLFDLGDAPPGWVKSDGLTGTMLQLLEDDASRGRQLDSGDAFEVFQALWSEEFWDEARMHRTARSLLASGSPAQRFAAVYALGAVGSFRSSELFESLLSDSDPRVAACAALQFRWREVSRDGSAYAALKELTGRVRTAWQEHAVAKALLKSAKPAASPEVLWALEHLPSGDRRFWVDELLISTREGGRHELVVSELHGERARLARRLCSSSSRKVRDCAFHALRETAADTTEIAGLLKILRSKRSPKRAEAMERLVSLPVAERLDLARRLLDSRRREERTWGLELLRASAAMREGCDPARLLVRSLDPESDGLSRLERLHLECILDPEYAEPEAADCFGLLPERDVSPERVPLEDADCGLGIRYLEDAARVFLEREPGFATKSFLWERLLENPDWDVESLALGMALADEVAEEHPCRQRGWLARLRTYDPDHSYASWIPSFRLEELPVELRLPFARARLQHLRRVLRVPTREDTGARASGRPDSWVSMNSSLVHLWPDEIEMPADLRSLWGELVRDRMREVEPSEGFCREVASMACQIGAFDGDKEGWWTRFLLRRWELGRFSYPHSLGSRSEFSQFPELHTAVERCRARVVEIECQRGELPSPVSMLARNLGWTGGLETLRAAMQALDGEDFDVRKKKYYHAPLRRHSLSLLVRKSWPREHDGEERFAQWVREAGLDTNDLRKLALFVPRWAPHVEAFRTCPGLTEAVLWVHAHLHQPKWDDCPFLGWYHVKPWVESFSTLDSEEIGQGEIDARWFSQISERLPADEWRALAKLAKYAGLGKGHRRIRRAIHALLEERCPGAEATRSRAPAP